MASPVSLQHAQAGREASQYGQAFAVGSRFSDNCRDLRVVSVTFQVEKKCIVPINNATGSFLDVSQIDRIAFEYVEDVNQCARSIDGCEHDGSFVIAGHLRTAFGQNQQPLIFCTLAINLILGVVKKR